MIKQFMSKTCAFDAEWVPCAETGRRLLGLPASIPEAEVVEAMWAHYRKEGDWPDVQPFLKLVVSKVVSIAAVFRTVEKGQITLELLSAGLHGPVTEAVLIRRFLERVAADGRQLWGFNSRSSDVPILVQRAIALGISLPKFANLGNRNQDYFYRYGDRHMDLLDVVQGFGKSARPSLHELAAACAIPGKLGTAGGDVAQLYLAGDVQAIVDYNEFDALTTHLLMLRVAHTAGHLDQTGYEAEQKAVRRLLADETAKGKSHLALFAEAWTGGGSESSQE